MKVLFLSAFDYPTRYAHAAHGLSMAHAFSKILGKNFSFIINTTLDEKLLQGIQCYRLFGMWGRTIKKLHLRRVLIPFSVLYFFYSCSTWRGDTTILYITDPKLLSAAVFVKKITGVRIYMEVHERLSDSDLNTVKQQVTRTFFVTPFLREEALQRLALRKDTALVLENAVDLELFSTVAPGLVRESLGIQKEDIVIGYVGRFAPLGNDKGLRLMMETLLSLPETVVCLFAGGTKDEIVEYRNIAHSLGVEKRTFFMQHVSQDQVPDIMQACNILAYVPERSDFTAYHTSPMKIYEYLAARRPIIVSDTPALRIATGGNAYFVPPGDKDSLPATIQEMLTNPDRVASLVEQGYTHVKENTWRNRAEKVLRS